uniref:hypothetical protein n=1 Tax=Nonomuraea pusilla TaxID=46177 RepID=UPI0006E1E0E4|nr:hypothetical protein [Nonomuraea pusilla]
MKSRPGPSRLRPSLAVAATALLTAATLASGAAPAAAQDAPSQSVLRHRALHGASIEIDPTFPYYKDRSPDSIADEIARNGYTAVHYFVVDENRVDGELVAALRERGIAVWALTLAFGSYTVEGYPAEWPSWEQKLLSASQPGFHSFSPWSADYLAFKKKSLGDLIKKYPFDGIELAESFLPDWNGFTSGFYGDLGPLAEAAFKAEYGLDMPDFTDPSSPRYYKTDTARYAKWVDFRVAGVNRFLGDLVRGEGGLRSARPGVLVGSWSVAVDAGPDSVRLERELQAVDAPAMIAAVRPDIHFIQTNWPDWLKPDLAPDYIKGYQPYVDEIRRSNPALPLGVQNDIGSTTGTARDRAWIGAFSDTASSMGFSTWTGYEFSLAKAMYTEAPEVRAIRCDRAAGTVEVSFQKRIDAASAARPDSFAVRTPAGRSHGVLGVEVDGNIAKLRLDGLPRGRFELAVRNVSDTPSLWVFNKTQQPNTVEPGYTAEGRCTG